MRSDSSRRLINSKIAKTSTLSASLTVATGCLHMGDDAILIARTQYKTTSVLKTLGKSPGLPSVTMTVTAYRSFLREAIFRLGRRVEILQTSSRNQWKVAKQASPGNLQDVEDELGGNIDSAPIILAVKVSAKATEARNVGVCFADASVRELGVSEFVDNDIYSNFESLLIQLWCERMLDPIRQ